MALKVGTVLNLCITSLYTHLIIVKVEVTYTLIGFSQYIIKNKILYRKSYKTKSISCKWQYRNERIINKTLNNGIIGYMLIKDKTTKPKFYSLKSLKHRLKRFT